MTLDHNNIRNLLLHCDENVPRSAIKGLSSILKQKGSEMTFSAWDGAVPARRLGHIYSGRLHRVEEKGLSHRYVGMGEFVSALRRLDGDELVRGVSAIDVRENASIALLFVNWEVTRIFGLILFSELAMRFRDPVG